MSIASPAIDSRTGAQLTDLTAWLVECLDAGRSLPVIFEGYCDRLVESGLPVFRVTLGLETLHPEDSGTMLTWRDGTMAKRRMTRAGVLASNDYLTSPTWVVDQTGRPFRWRRGEPTGGRPLIEELAADGMSDYLMLPLPFQDDTRTATMSYATRGAAGFDAAAVAFMHRASTLLSPAGERVVLRRIARDLLAAYVGPRAGARVYDGRIDRGDVETLSAAILFADLRGFTAMSERLDRVEVVALLNRWFDVMGEAIEAAGGEILKFVGDGILAVFPVDGAVQEGAASDGAAGTGDRSDTCERALAGALAGYEGTRQLAAELEAAGREPLACGLALHLGEVAYGNIGTRRRLDFTVIGPAVNHASRLQDLTKVLGEPVVASAAFAAALGRKLRPLGRHGLRGVAEPIAVFAPR